MSTIAHNLNLVRERIKKAAQANHEHPDDIRLVAVSKTKPVGDIMEAYNAGQRHFGENYIQELLEKSPQLPSDIQWHFIGNLQSNKIKSLSQVQNLYAVESVDSIKKADLLNKCFEGRTPPLSVFIQVNTSGEENKGGIEPKDCDEIIKHILEKCSSLKLAGLMTIGAIRELAPDEKNPDFQALSDLGDRLEQRYSHMLELSMGMSDDFEEAIEMGATNVRVGSKIFGSRK